MTVIVKLNEGKGNVFVRKHRCNVRRGKITRVGWLKLLKGIEKTGGKQGKKDHNTGKQYIFIHGEIRLVMPL